MEDAPTLPPRVNLQRKIGVKRCVLKSVFFGFFKRSQPLRRRCRRRQPAADAAGRVAGAGAATSPLVCRLAAARPISLSVALPLLRSCRRCTRRCQPALDQRQAGGPLARGSEAMAPLCSGDVAGATSYVAPPPLPPPLPPPPPPPPPPLAACCRATLTASARRALASLGSASTSTRLMARLRSIWSAVRTPPTATWCPSGHRSKQRSRRRRAPDRSSPEMRCAGPSSTSSPLRAYG